MGKKTTHVSRRGFHDWRNIYPKEDNSAYSTLLSRIHESTNPTPPTPEQAQIIQRLEDMGADVGIILPEEYENPSIRFRSHVFIEDWFYSHEEFKKYLKKNGLLLSGMETGINELSYYFRYAGVEAKFVCTNHPGF
jgi:hypothetical protein